MLVVILKYANENDCIASMIARYIEDILTTRVASTKCDARATDLGRCVHSRTRAVVNHSDVTLSISRLRLAYEIIGLGLGHDLILQFVGSDDICSCNHSRDYLNSSLY
jgi:hypothetical protein